MDEKVDKLMELLEPCLKKEKHNGSLKYKTTFGYKTEEGLRASEGVYHTGSRNNCRGSSSSSMRW